MTHEHYPSTSELCQRYGVSSRTLYNWQRNRGFPRPLNKGGHGVESRWRESDIRAWEDRQVAA
jgi:predicted DNA-binding transcriptional regulator AlpA